MHEITGSSLARADRRQARRLRQVRPAEDALRPVHGVGRHSGLPRHRRQQGAEPAAGSRGSAWAAAAATSSSTAPKANGAPTSSRCRAPARSTPRSTSTRKSIFVVEGRGSTEVWLEGDSKRHVFEWQKGSLFSIPLNAMHRIVNASSAPALLLGGTTAPNVMNLINNIDVDLQLPVSVPRPLLRRRRLLQVEGRHRARSGARPRHAADQLHSRHRQLRPAARQPPLARLPPHRAVHDRQHASICGSASTRTAATPRRTRTPRRPC